MACGAGSSHRSARNVPTSAPVLTIDLQRTNQFFDEVHVYEGIAERTGITVDRGTLRSSKSVCRSLAELTRKARRMGDGHFYLAGLVWPDHETRIDLSMTWTTFTAS